MKEEDHSFCVRVQNETERSLMEAWLAGYRSKISHAFEDSSDEGLGEDEWKAIGEDEAAEHVTRHSLPHSPELATTKHSAVELAMINRGGNAEQPAQGMPYTHKGSPAGDAISNATEEHEVQICPHCKQKTPLPTFYTNENSAAQMSCLSRLWTFLWSHYFEKMEGGLSQTPPRVKVTEMMFSWVGCFISTAVLSVVQLQVLHPLGYNIIVGSFGAMSILLFGLPKSPFAQPRHHIAGNILSALIGVTCKLAFGGLSPTVAWLAPAIAVPTSLLAMQITNTIYPPGGSTALIAANGNLYPGDGYLFVVLPILSGITVLQICAVLLNNLVPTRRYPLYWFGWRRKEIIT